MNKFHKCKQINYLVKQTFDVCFTFDIVRSLCEFVVTSHGKTITDENVYDVNTSVDQQRFNIKNTT